MIPDLFFLTKGVGRHREQLQSFELALRDAGIQFDPETAWDECKQLFKTTGLIIKTANITQSANGDKNGFWSTTVAAAVFVSPKKEPM